MRHFLDEGFPLFRNKELKKNRLAQQKEHFNDYAQFSRIRTKLQKRSSHRVAGKATSETSSSSS
jgi:hypothetical protein